MNREIETLRAILEATREGRLKWRRAKSDSYLASGPGGPVKLWFEYPQLGSGSVAGADLAKLTVGKVELSFFSGTDGMYLIRSILHAGVAEFREHLDGIDDRLEQAIAQMKSA